MVRPGINQVKICGITRQADLAAVCRLGFSTVGFILYPKSPRFVDPSKLSALVQPASPFITRVGVTVNASVDEIQSWYAAGCIDRFQLHGDESAAYCEQLAAKGIPFYKAFRLGPDFDFALPSAYPGDTVLLDAYHPDEYGGTGKSWCWSDVKTKVGKKVIAAGGLNPDNIMDAAAATHADAFDLSSGVELSPGIKSEEKLVRLVHRLSEQSSY